VESYFLLKGIGGVADGVVVKHLGLVESDGFAGVERLCNGGVVSRGGIDGSFKDVNFRAVAIDGQCKRAGAVRE